MPVRKDAKTRIPSKPASGLMGWKTPRTLGYVMPAEWEPHEATWLAWPHNREDWPGKFAAIPWLYAEIVRLLAAHERVHLIVENAAMEKRVVSMLERAGADLDRVSFHRWPTDRGWTRDSGPIFVRKAKGEVAVTNWRGQVRRLASGRQAARPRGEAARIAGVAARGAAGWRTNAEGCA
jgi:hypothetical protein